MDIPTAAGFALTGAIAVGTTVGWWAERGESDAERLATLESKVQHNADAIKNVADGVARVEDLLLGAGYGKGK